MRLKNIKIIFIIIVLLSIFNGCTTENEDIVTEDVLHEDIVVEDIVVEAGTYEYSYVEVIAGKKITYTKEIEEAPLPVILNDWISDLNKKNVNYGNTPNGNSILESLEVKSAYLKGNTAIIVMNKDFTYFDDGYSMPYYFIDGFQKILRQVTEASDFSIEAEGYNNSIIHPDGVLIKNITIRSQEN